MKIRQAYVGMSITDHWPHFSVHTDCILHVLLLASTALAAVHIVLIVDHRNDNYITMFHLASRLWRAHSHALLMRTMQLCGLLKQMSKKLNLNSNL